MRNNSHIEPTVAELITSVNKEYEADRHLAARYAPVLQFDANEPFLPLVAGFTIFRQSAELLVPYKLAIRLSSGT